MTDNPPRLEVSTLDSLSDPTTLVDEGVPIEENVRECDHEKFEGLRERYDAIDGVVQVAVTTSDGRLLLQGWDGASAWAPPGFSVHPGKDWLADTRERTEQLTGVDVCIDDVLLVDDLTFEHAETGETFSAYGVSFGASLADEDSEFAENPTFGADSPLADEDMALAWVTDVPDDVNENHRDEIERFLEYAGPE
jgi:hypothetical protein